jgi:hypothetical protein
MRDRIRAMRSKFEISLAKAEARLYLFITPNQWLSAYVKHEMSKIEKKSHLIRILSVPRTTFDKINSQTISTNSWKNALLFSIGLIIFLIFLAFFLKSPIATFFPKIIMSADSISSIVSTAWQVSASVIGISFVLVIFLIEYLHKDRYESQIFPLFSQYTKFHFIVIFGLVTLASVGITLSLLSINYIHTDELLAILVYNIILQLTNLALIIFLYGRTFEFIRPNIFLKILGDELDKSTRQSVVAELKKRLGENYLHDTCRDLKIEFTPFRPNNRTLESINAKESINSPQAITDIHIGLIKRAAELSKMNQKQGKENLIIVWMASIGNIINKERKEIAYSSSQTTAAHPAASYGVFE